MPDDRGDNKTLSVWAAWQGKMRMTVFAVLTVAATGVLGFLSYDGWFGPTLCWPRDFDEDRAIRILRRDPPIAAFLRLKKACIQNDEVAMQRLWPIGTADSTPDAGSSLSEEVVQASLDTTRSRLRSARLDWENLWTAWLEWSPETEGNAVLLGGENFHGAMMYRQDGAWRFR